MASNEVVTRSLPLPAKMTGLLIGKSGSNLERIRLNTGCECFIDTSPQTRAGFEWVHARIKGTPSQVYSATIAFMIMVAGWQHS